MATISYELPRQYENIMYFAWKYGRIYFNTGYKIFSSQAAKAWVCICMLIDNLKIINLYVFISFLETYKYI